MAMDDVLRLAKGLLLDGEIVLPGKGVGLMVYGPWISARVSDVSIYIDHLDSMYFGNARIQIEGEDKWSQHSFQELWAAGWTSVEFMEARKKSELDEKKRRLAGSRKAKKK